jgi:hypothetical protein
MTTDAELRTAANPAVIAAAANDLYRVAGCVPAVFRTRAGQPIDTHAVAVAIALGLMGRFAERETLADGTLVDRLDLSEGGLDWYLKQTGA